MTPAFVGFNVVALVGGAAEMASVLGCAQEPAGLERGHRVEQTGANRCLCSANARAAQLRHGPGTDEPAILAGRRGDDAHRHHDRRAGDEQRRSAWFVGVLVLMVYLIFAMTLYLLPPRAQ